MNNATLFHHWAHQVKPRGANAPKGKSGNVFYEGPILYSYGHHFPLAVLTGKKTPDGREVVLVNSRKYSVTTGSHKSQAVRASSHKFHIYVPRPDQDTSVDNLEHLNAETKAAYEKLKKIRSFVDWTGGNVPRGVETAKLYRKVFLKGRGHVFALPKDFDAVLTAAREREAKHAARDAAKQENQRKWNDLCKLNALAAVEKIAAWRKGEAGTLPYGLQGLTP